MTNKAKPVTYLFTNADTGAVETITLNQLKQYEFIKYEFMRSVFENSFNNFLELFITIEYINPEEALAAALSSCHMMSFLFVASKKKYIVETYEDASVAILAKNDKNKMAVTQLYLKPKVTFRGENQPDKAAIDALHHLAHEECFIANSVLTEIIIDPVY